jgi:hypothetical protein
VEFLDLLSANQIKRLCFKSGCTVKIRRLKTVFLNNEQQEPVMTGCIYVDNALPEVYGQFTEASQKPLLGVRSSS